jgi:hypothetical protein
MSKMRILIAAVAVLGLGRGVQADDTPPGQLPMPGALSQGSTAGGSETRYLSLIPPPISGSSCAAGTCGTGACGTGSCSEKGCLASIWSFFTYRRLPYTDINTLCCGCSGPSRPPLYVYFLHPCADKAPPRELPDLSQCGSCKNGRCSSCGRGVAPGCTSCPSCGR